MKVVYLRSVELFYFFKEELKEKISVALKYFPELKYETIYVGVITDNSVDGRADDVNRIIKFRVNVPPSYVTVFHELAHLAIRWLSEQGVKLPKTEEFCSIFAMARMPPELIDINKIPYIGEPRIPKEQIPILCRKALEYRKKHRNYIQWLRKQAKIV